MLETVPAPAKTRAKWPASAASGMYDDAWSYGDAGGYPTFAGGPAVEPPADRALRWEWATPAECAAAELAAVQTPDRPEPRATAVVVGVAMAWYVVDGLAALLNG